jgi:hypothetical protein
MPDPEVHDVFARINTYSERLKPQELRNAKFFGDFKSSVYSLNTQCVVFLEKNKVFTPKQILRMAEAELISELLLAMQEGIREGNKAVIDTAYKKYDDRLPNRRGHEKNLLDVFDVIGNIFNGDLVKLKKVRSARLFYPLFCAVHHLKSGLPRLNVPRASLKAKDYPKIKSVLTGVDALVTQIQVAEKAQEEITLAAADRRFYEAYDEHWVHATNRTTLTQYFCRNFLKALN